MPLPVVKLLSMSLLVLALGSSSVADELPLLLTEQFENGMDRWETTDSKAGSQVWKIAEVAHSTEGNSRENHVLRVTGKSTYKPPYRSPHSIAWLKDTIEGSVEISARLQNTNPTAGGHRDLCLFWGGQDAAHYYYVHLGAKADPHACQVFIVDGSARKAITLENENTTPWTEDWHQAKVKHNTATGLIEIFFDDMKKPRMVARDKTFTWGRIGLGTFDDHGNFDDVTVRGVRKSENQPVTRGELTENGAVIRIDGKPFTEYLKNSGHQPVIWPIIGPTGKAVTRSYPLGPLLDHEVDDHPHHRSLWFTHGDVNNIDFWIEPEANGPIERKGYIVHQEFKELSEQGPDLRIVTRNDWISDEEKILEDERTIVFGADADGSRWIDFTVLLKATVGDVILGDTKEGSFAVRVAGAMKVNEKLGGQLLNSAGQTDKAAWGQPATWVDNTGPLGEKDTTPVGITIFSHPQNFRHPSLWHARDYGLVAGNPFGQKHFPPGDLKQGAATMKQGDTLKLRYKVWIHAGRLDREQIDTKSESIFD
ncbi:DUF6807 domain-containing protein [Adhaeretor mobilis]|uniref:Uncharacterized protein n=1 Tax=Adhaeretor mobilis TaxID=1930276 RepID=A0A517MUG4_9BACT|nr:PmoA family protein [Adhaeretor mobilis]QDS98523.1 hypothetical protein HG15A2_18040 [Adhaeretor mobilis]